MTRKYPGQRIARRPGLRGCHKSGRRARRHRPRGPKSSPRKQDPSSNDMTPLLPAASGMPGSPAASLMTRIASHASSRLAASAVGGCQVGSGQTTPNPYVVCDPAPANAANASSPESGRLGVSTPVAHYRIRPVNPEMTSRPGRAGSGSASGCAPRHRSPIPGPPRTRQRRRGRRMQPVPPFGQSPRDGFRCRPRRGPVPPAQAAAAMGRAHAIAGA